MHKEIIVLTEEKKKDYNDPVFSEGSCGSESEMELHLLEVTGCQV